MRLRATAIVLLVAAASGVAAFVVNRPPPGRPDIVLVIWDTCRADHVLTGDDGPELTPRLAAFAGEAVRFDRCFSPASWTAPAHASLFTGNLPARHGMDEGVRAHERPGVPLLAETLREAGYETVGFSANAYLSPLTGLSRGFETFVQVTERKGAMKPGDSGVVLSAVDAWLEERRGRPPSERPLFLFVNLMDAHLPCRPSQGSLDAVLDGSVPMADIAAGRRIGARAAMRHDLGIDRLPPATLSGMRALYRGAVRELDGATSRLFEGLRGAGILEGAVVVVTADHGEQLGELGRLDHRNTLHDVTLHVPLIVRWPGHLKGGGTVSTPVSLSDLHPTLLEAAGLEPPPGTALDARSLTAAEDRDRVLFAFQGHGVEHLPAMRRSFPGEADDRAFELIRLSLRAARRTGPDGAHWKYLDEVRHGDDGSVGPATRHLFIEGGDETGGLLGPDPADPRRSMAEGLRALLDAAELSPTERR